MTDLQRTVLVQLSDGDWRQGCELTRSPGVLGKLLALDMCRCDFDHLPMYERLFTITPRGVEALEVAS